tara:strand:+ start:462 stop:1055 length:594 start_codon:yes stop_codon:yes gene_type:complete
MIKKINNVLTKTYSNKLEDQIKIINWNYMNSTASDKDVGDYTYSFSHTLIDKDKVTSSSASVFHPAMLECMKKCDLSESEYYIYRARLGLIVRTPNKVVHTPHIDYESEGVNEGYLNIVYYVNESDGDTYIFKNTESESVFKNIFKDFSLNDVVANTYKKNSLVMFDGTLWHSSSTPIHHNARMVMNLNLFKKTLKL